MIVNESSGFLNCDVVLISHDHVLNNLSEMVALVEKYAEKACCLTETREQIALFWQNMLQKLQTCFTDCQQLRCY
jgi:hypothetical protein